MIARKQASSERYRIMRARHGNTAWANSQQTGIPIYQFKTVIVVAGILLFFQGIAQVMRCILCIRTGTWPPLDWDVEETETILMQKAIEDDPHGPA